MIRRVTGEVRQGDCREVLATLEEGSVDAIITDPPYELGFMGRAWDKSGVAFNADTWRAALRVLKPGGHMLAFGGTRTYHRMTCAIEDAGFEIRDCLMWLYGSGFPKSLDISKAIDKAAGATREILGERQYEGGHVQRSTAPRFNGLTHSGGREYREGAHRMETIPATPDAATWQGWGTGLKPAYEPIILARKPLDGTVAANVLEHGTGGINIDGCRIGITPDDDIHIKNPHTVTKGGGIISDGLGPSLYEVPAAGRWPANVLLDGEAAAALDEQSGELKTGAWTGQRNRPKTNNVFGKFGTFDEMPRFGDSGGASRFFYCAKASRREREAGCEYLPARTGAEAVDREPDTAGVNNPRAGAGRTASQIRNHHATVKPVALMRYLVRLITPPGGLVLDPFCGSGSTGCAAVAEGFNFLGVERESEYVAIAEARIANAQSEPGRSNEAERQLVLDMAASG